MFTQLYNYYNNADYEKLIGRKILDIGLSDDQTTVQLKTDKGNIYLIVEGDCCSESWYYAINGIKSLIGGTITSVQDLEMPEAYVEQVVNDGHGRQDVDILYGFTLVTEKGRCDFEFRNSSNGYYGGWLVISEDHYLCRHVYSNEWKAFYT